MHSSTLILFLLFAANVDRAISVLLDDFFKFNTPSDEKVPRGDDNHVGPISLQQPIKYFAQAHSKIYVSTNGILSFNRGVSQFEPESFPLDNELFVAPFWADVDTRCDACGTVFYRQTTSSEELEKASEQIRAVYPTLESFRAQLLFIATWDHVGVYSYNSSVTNTFQAIIVSGGSRSFSIFNYLTNGIQWTFGDASRGSHAQAGFNKGDNNVYEDVLGSFTDAMINVGSTSNCGVRGRWIFQIDDEEIKPAEQSATGEDVEGIIFPHANLYDVIYNVNGQFIDGMMGKGLVSYVRDFQLLKDMEDVYYGAKVCAVGPFKSGKTWLLKNLCKKDIPDGFLIQTKGISIAFTDEDIACIDTEGEHRVEEFSRGKWRKATDQFHQDVALSICDFVIIVINGLTSMNRVYVDQMLDKVMSLSKTHATKKVIVVHNFKDREKPEIISQYIQDTILKAYCSERIVVRGKGNLRQRVSHAPNTGCPKFDGNSWAFFQHSYCPDHHPHGREHEQVMTVTHLVLAKANTSAGDFWNERSFNHLTRQISAAVEESGTGLNVTKDVAQGIAKLLPHYYMAEKKDTTNAPSSYIQAARAWLGQKLTSVMTFAYTKGLTQLGFNTNTGGSVSRRLNPYEVQLVKRSAEVFSLRLVHHSKYKYNPFPLKGTGEPMDGYALACRAGKVEDTITLMCDVPGVKLVGLNDELKMGEMKVTVARAGRPKIIVKGIRDVPKSMENIMYSTVEKSFSGPFQTAFEAPVGFAKSFSRIDDAEEQKKYVTYKDGVLQIKLEHDETLVHSEL